MFFQVSKLVLLNYKLLAGFLILQLLITHIFILNCSILRRSTSTVHTRYILCEVYILVTILSMLLSNLFFFFNLLAYFVHSFSEKLIFVVDFVFDLHKYFPFLIKKLFLGDSHLFKHTSLR